MEGRFSKKASDSSERPALSTDVALKLRCPIQSLVFWKVSIWPGKSDHLDYCAPDIPVQVLDSPAGNDQVDHAGGVRVIFWTFVLHHREQLLARKFCADDLDEDSESEARNTSRQPWTDLTQF